MTQEHDPTTRRLGQIAGLCVTGQAAAAEIELADWLREADCPPAARVMLAALLARRRAFDEARRVLHAGSHDPLEMLTLLALLTRDAQPDDDARRLAERLHAEFSHLPFVRQWLAVMGGEIAALPRVPEGRVEQLAAELLVAFQAQRSPLRGCGMGLFRALVAAQQYEPDPARLALLRRAIARIAPEFAGSRDLVGICHALAELALLADDHDEARRWAHRGLKIDPYHAALALVLSKLPDDANVGAPAAHLLRQVAERHPAYLDVRAALIRREHGDGNWDDARRRLADWLAADPANRLARQLQHELVFDPEAETRGERAA